MADMSNDELLEILKEHGRPAILHTDDDGTRHVEEVDVLDVLRSQLGEDARLLDEHLSTLSEEEIEQFRKESWSTHIDKEVAEATMRARRKRLRAFLDEQRDS